MRGLVRGFMGRSPAAHASLVPQQCTCCNVLRRDIHNTQHAFYQDRFAALSMTAFLFLIAIVLYRARSAVRSALEICPSRASE